MTALAPEEVLVYTISFIPRGLEHFQDLATISSQSMMQGGIEFGLRHGNGRTAIFKVGIHGKDVQNSDAYVEMPAETAMPGNSIVVSAEEVITIRVWLDFPMRTLAMYDLAARDPPFVFHHGLTLAHLRLRPYVSPARRKLKWAKHYQDVYQESKFECTSTLLMVLQTRLEGIGLDPAQSSNRLTYVSLFDQADGGREHPWSELVENYKNALRMLAGRERRSEGTVTITSAMGRVTVEVLAEGHGQVSAGFDQGLVSGTQIEQLIRCVIPDMLNHITLEDAGQGRVQGTGDITLGPRCAGMPSVAGIAQFRFSVITPGA